MGCDLTRNDASARPVRMGCEDTARCRLQAGENARAAPAPAPTAAASWASSLQKREEVNCCVRRPPVVCGGRRDQAALK